MDTCAWTAPNPHEGMRPMTKNEPVIRLFFAKMKAAFLELPDEQKAAFMRKDRENLDYLGMQPVMMVDCRSTSSEWDYIGIEQWPTMAAIRERERFERDELKVSKYVESKTYLGTAQSFAEYGKS
jgi:hypothetical protein